MIIQPDCCTRVILGKCHLNQVTGSCFSSQTLIARPGTLLVLSFFTVQSTELGWEREEVAFFIWMAHLYGWHISSLHPQGMPSRASLLLITWTIESSPNSDKIAAGSGHHVQNGLCSLDKTPRENFFFRELANTVLTPAAACSWLASKLPWKNK